MTEDEEYARSELYGVLAMLFYGPPSQAVLDLIEGAAIEGEGVRADAWRGLQAVSSQTSAESARDEYEALFIGVGKPDVMLYGSYYLSGFLMEKPLAALRSDLARLGLERSEHLSESEDHFAALCDAMRLLHGNIATQKEFFANHIQTLGPPNVRRDRCPSLCQVLPRGGRPGARLRRRGDPGFRYDWQLMHD
jgi:TorA maturation chaperone TorD